jgi:hypothetical protein
MLHVNLGISCGSGEDYLCAACTFNLIRLFFFASVLTTVSVAKVRGVDDGWRKCHDAALVELLLGKPEVVLIKPIPTSPHSFIHSSVSRQVQSLFQSELST